MKNVTNVTTTLRAPTTTHGGSLRATRTTTRAYALPLVLLVLSIVALAVAGISYVVEASTVEASRITGELRGRAACDSIVGIAGAMVEAELRQRPSATPDELVVTVCRRSGGCTTAETTRQVPNRLAPPDTTVLDFFVGPVTDVPPSQRAIVAGDFGGLMADEALLSVFVRAKDNRSGRECIAEENLALASLTPLQFDVFVEPESDWRAALPRDFTRLHHNHGLRDRRITVDVKTDADDARLGMGAPPPEMQGANRAEATSMRWLLDPPRRGDSPEVSARRLANVADLRIIDGVWYLNVPEMPWPGKAIWSDHPGRNVSHQGAAGRMVGSTSGIGQGDIFSGAKPKRFSHYETTSQDILQNDSSRRSIVSYGALKQSVSGAEPAFYPSMISDTEDICGNTDAATMGQFRTVSSCSGNTTLALADSTRGGFEHNGKNILPLNFDVAALREALLDGSPNELGALFRGRPFNGVVWVTQTWSESDRGLGLPGTAPRSAPAQGVDTAVKTGEPGPLCVASARATGSPSGGGGGSPLLAPPSSLSSTGKCAATGVAAGQQTATQGQLPKPLCSNNTGSYTRLGVQANELQLAVCNEYGADGGSGAVPNAVRVVQAGNVDPDVFPSGLTIATNLPLYVQGHVNNASVSSGRRKVLLAGDRVTLLSEQFQDESRPWNTSRPLAMAGASVVMASVLTGIPSRGADIEQVFMAAERWRPSYAIVRGGIVAGFNSVIDEDAGPTVGVGLLLETDEQLRDPRIQPPGMVRVLAGVAGRWRR